MVTAIGPGAESVGVLLWAAAPGSGRWSRSSWDGAPWAVAAWQSVGCDVGEVAYRWGAADESGILSIAQAGELDVSTIDPGRQLDPLNTASPYYGAVRPGAPLRIVGYTPAERIVATAFLDVAGYDVASSRGRLRAVDGIAYLAQAQLADGASLPNTLRARTRAIVAAVGLGSLVPVQGESETSNVVADGDAESYPDAYQTMPAGWSKASGTGTFGTSAGQTHAGSRAFRAAGPIEVVGNAYGVVGGSQYQLAGWRYRESWGDGAVTVYVHQYRADGSYAGNTGSGSARLIWAVGIGADQWVKLEIPYVAPADVASVRLGIVANAGADWIDDLALVGPIPGTELETDPPVAAHDGKSAPAWQTIAAAAQDALTYVWIDPTGMLRFRSFGALPPAGFAIGCPPADADPGDQWLGGLSTIESSAAADAIRNSVRAYSSGTVWAPAAIDPISIARYGARPLDVERVVPDRATWADRILADRGDAGLEVAIGELRPYTELELRAILDLGLAGPSIIRARDDAHGTEIDLDVAVLGARVGVTPAGWRTAYVTMIPRIEWDAIEPEPPIPPIPPATPWHVETRSYVATSDALVALTSGGAKYGAGAASSSPVGSWSGWTYRSLVAFPSIPWSKVRALRTATLKVRTSSQIRVGFGSSPKAQLRRIASSWSAGSATAPSGSNSVVWPGPTTTSSGAVTVALPKTQGADAALRCDAIARSWAPSSAGGSGAGQYGIALYEASGSTSNTTEILPVEAGGTARPTLELVLEVFD